MTVSFPEPPTNLSIAVLKAMQILFVKPSQLLKVPALRLIVEPAEKPERSSVLLVPMSQIVMIGVVLIVKSKNISVGPWTLQLKPKVCPPERGVEVGNP